MAALTALLDTPPADRTRIMQEQFPDLTRSQIDGRAFRLKQQHAAQVKADNPDVALWQARAREATESVQQHAEQLAEVYDWLRPVELPAPAIPKVRAKPNPYTLIIGDFHFPHEDAATIAIFLQAVAALKPQRVILNGDTVDLLAVSKYKNDARKQFSHTLQDEVAAFHRFLHQLHSIGDAWGMEVVETESNHAGNGTASRWWRYLSDRCPELLSHDNAAEWLSYQRWFYPKWSSIKLVENVLIADDLLVVHGDIVRGKGGYSARATGEKWMSSTLNNHTHRAGASIRRVPAVGSRAEGVYRNYEIGCACSLDPCYATVPDWANAFAIVSHDEEHGDYGVEIVNVTRKRASIAALGYSLAA